MIDRDENDDTQFMMFDGLPAAIVINLICWALLYGLWRLAHG